MITITRRQARRLRGVFRRYALGIAHRGPVPPLVLRAEGAGLRVRHHHAALAVEHAVPGADRPEESIALPLDALADFEGKDDAAVVLEAAAPGRTVVRWEDRGIPQVPRVRRPRARRACRRSPSRRRRGRGLPGGLLDALAEAAATTDEDSTRYALDCLQLRGRHRRGRRHRRPADPDPGRLPLPLGGRRPGPPLAALRLPGAAPRPAGRGRPGPTPTSCSGPAPGRSAWRSRPTPASRGSSRSSPTPRPRPPGSGSTPRTPRSWPTALDRLPGGDGRNAPVTVDLNGRVAVRARGDGRGPASPSWSWPAPATPARRCGSTPTATSWPGRSGSGFAEVEVVGADSPGRLPRRPPGRTAGSRSRRSRRSGRPTTPSASSPPSRRSRPPRVGRQSRGESPTCTRDHPGQAAVEGQRRRRTVRNATTAEGPRPRRPGGADPGGRGAARGAGRRQGAGRPADRGPAPPPPARAAREPHPGVAQGAQAPGGRRVGKPHVRPCVQRRLMCSVGVSPTGGRAEPP